ncbi:hypothetical protein KYI07_06250 [Macrococcus psychrotolerans]|uniref:Uncharacterized protein n=1 Tax=Macrococcus psychrotolerans TaxID=3039389 RepID=A0AAT9P337_9STAP|nr:MULTISPECIES: hypothetical protein [Macrococcus]QYA32001.1 hypothetical protein KYI10_06260 [Macrococcus sp. 19Msa1099]QYA36807.1 hypothetical protein KYI07_06250 [Macrococcus caseolyticus]QYA75515.1 hypothetical protein KYI12_06250 [Macrococcus caseolyticus]
MEIKSTISAEQLTEGIRYYGETSADMRVVERINELDDILWDVCVDLDNLRIDLINRHEASAKDILIAIDNLQRNIKRTLPCLD